MHFCKASKMATIIAKASEAVLTIRTIKIVAKTVLNIRFVSSVEMSIQELLVDLKTRRTRFFGLQ